MSRDKGKGKGKNKASSSNNSAASSSNSSNTTSGIRLATGQVHDLFGTQIRWFKWDGIEDLHGTCNHVTAPINPALGADDPNLMLRLKHLGYDFPENLTPDAKNKCVWMALKEVLAFLNIPAQKVRGKVDFQQNTPPAAAGMAQAIHDLLAGQAKTALETLDDALDPLGSGATSFSTQGGIGYRLRSRPDHFTPLNESAGIEVEFCDLQNVNSLLLKISTENDVLVYQEIFDAQAWSLIPLMKPKDQNLITHHPHKAFLMNQKSNELSGPYPRLRKPGAFNRAFAPYRIEILLSGEADAFLANTQGVYHTAPGKTVITTETLKPPEDLGELHLMGRNCRKHNRQFLEANEIILFDPFVCNQIEKDALRTYTDFQQRAALKKNQSCHHACEEGRNCQAPTTCQTGFWSIPELKGTFENISRHMNRFEQQFCCGSSSQPEPGSAIADLKGQIPAVLDAMRKKIFDLVLQKYPYRPCIEFIGRFVMVVEHILGVTKVDGEVAHFSEVYNDTDSAEYNLLRKGRTRAEIWRTEVEDTGRLEATRPKRQATLMETFELGLKEIHEYHIPEVMKKSEVIVFPSYNPLNTTFFRRTRSVPLFVAALIDFKYLIADKIYMTPFQFFNHDNFHIVGVYPYTTATTTTPSPQLWDTLESFARSGKLALTTQAYPVARTTLYAYYDAVAKFLEVHIQALEDAVTIQNDLVNIYQTLESATSEQDAATEYSKAKAFLSAVNTYLFTLIHEPIHKSDMHVDFIKFTWASVMEPKNILERMHVSGLGAPIGIRQSPNPFLKVIKGRFDSGFFGRIQEGESYTPAEMEILERSMNCAECLTGNCRGQENNAGIACVQGWLETVLEASRAVHLFDFDSWLLEEKRKQAIPVAHN